MVGETLGSLTRVSAYNKLDHELGSYSFYQAVPFYSAPVALVTAGRCGLQCNLTSEQTTLALSQWRYSIPDN